MRKQTYNILVASFFILLLLLFIPPILNKLNFFINVDKDTRDFFVTLISFIIGGLAFYFVIVQISTLAEQVQNEKERHNKDSEFKNFLEATKMLTSSKSKNNTEAQISAMYLLYDFAKNYPKNNLEKVMKILNRYVVPIYENSSTEITTSFKPKTDRKLITDRELINSWRENGNPEQQIAFTALELNKKLFVYALGCNELKNINLSGVVIFDLDIEIDIDVDFEKTKYCYFFYIKRLRAIGRLLDKLSSWLDKLGCPYPAVEINRGIKKSISERTSEGYYLSNIINNSKEMLFLCCDFKQTDSNKKISFSSESSLEKPIKPDSTKNRMNISRSKFINCDLSGCDFSYSNLWGVSFEDCDCNTKFNQAECEGVEFTGTTIVKEEQLKQMLFISKNIFDDFSRNKERKEKIYLKYGVIYKGNTHCFSNTEEYKNFVAYKNNPERKICQCKPCEVPDDTV